MVNKELIKKIGIFIALTILLILLIDSFISFIPELEELRSPKINTIFLTDRGNDIFVYSHPEIFALDDNIIYKESGGLETGKILDITDTKSKEEFKKLNDFNINTNKTYKISTEFNETFVKNEFVLGKIDYSINKFIFYIPFLLIIAFISLLLTNLIGRFKFIFNRLGERLNNNFKFLKGDLILADINLRPEDYLKSVLAKTATLFLFLILSISVISIRLGNYYLGILMAILISSFYFVRGLNYPKLRKNRRISEIERNLLPALRTILIQINSGVALFDVFVSLSRSDYGEISKIFSKLIKKINTGTPQIAALEEMTKNNPSPFFRKSIWQLTNGMKSGSNVSKVLRNILDSLSKEQIIQIEKYGSQLNPLSMFYMLFVVIMPSLSITFITVASSFFSSADIDNRFLLIGLFIVILIFQIVFLGMIKTRRPNLLEE